MKHKIVVIIVCGFALILACACGSPARTIEVTRIVPQTVMVTQLVTQIVRVVITTTPLPTNTLQATSTPTPKWTPDYSLANINVITPTPGILVIDNNTRPNVEQFIPAEYIKEYLMMNYGSQPHGGKVFCGYTTMGIGNDGHTIKLYVWADCAEYYLQDQEIKMGSASSIPVVLYVEVRFGTYKIVDTQYPGGGEQFLAQYFPPEMQKLVLDLDHAPKAFTDGIAAAERGLMKDAEAFFGN